MISYNIYLHGVRTNHLHTYEIKPKVVRTMTVCSHSKPFASQNYKMKFGRGPKYFLLLKSRCVFFLGNMKS